MNIIEKLKDWWWERNQYLDLVKREEIKRHNQQALKKLKRRKL